MSSKYQKAFSLPEEFPNTLREFTKEVLRDQPKDINKYAYEYFMAKIQAAAAGDSDGAAAEAASPQ
eukprot:CAMPEP_0197418028 /NCGR_PEP_ID=MMETSP1170-20131217/3899_1 /TAXON_ID=54406 /ORGANISM="Sarcinochrysis sp, Strain CCMP770" /LENGTH=65 /DNA_ID=CAMNT_0042945041 /DNA_START=58 /DNA_END=255 /DNA_ORIENTATION=-